VAVEFGPPGLDLSQGDLFDLVPSLHVEDLGYLEKFADRKYQIRSSQPPSLKVESPHAGTAMAVRRPAILLSHECEIDKDHKRATVLMALVRSLERVREEDRDGIRQYTRHRAFYLPANEYLEGENYADLRVVTTFRRDALESLKRLATVDDDGRRMLREHLFRFFTRRFLPDDWPTWPSDEEPA